MFVDSQPADPGIHETAVRMARRCRHIIQACLREEEWSDADREFYRVCREELEQWRASASRHTGREVPRP
ncbi:hypothetical protein [Paludisphaera borealis]|uniref:Uncharacterized protein n=1 Tax=Paludisphaera borealis TaxID=1387353 RepID=A0A1U7CID6_9BACT|nr:hypothetical protein [Paludisphaera borealis]APW58643.1 hypothetical protein BSF38_00041 [Paludisphaera borealis]